MIPTSIAERFKVLQRETPYLRAYALVDGVQYTKSAGLPLQPSDARRALFQGTEDQGLAYAGPWLIDLAQEAPDNISTISTLELTAPSVVWLFSRSPLETLALALQQRLNGRLPDGKIALIRFWDPRVLVTLFKTLDLPTRRDYFSDADEWHAQLDGKRFHISIHV